MVDLVIFDSDGVLVDSEPITSAVLADAVAELGIAWGTPKGLAAFRGGSLPDVLAAIERDLGRPAPEDFVPRMRKRLFARLRREVTAVEGIVDALDALERTGRVFCVASNGPHAKMQATLGSTGLWPRFAGRVFSACDTGRFKPDPDLFLRAARAMDARPARCVVVEDSGHGLAAAAAAGMPAVAYVEPGRAVETDGVPRIAHMRELLGAIETIT